MKVRVKGLVFAGFAAAIFAQSAMADNNADAKTVTSKLYVDQKIDKEITSGTTTIDEDSPNDKAPSSKNVYDFVTGQISDAAITVAADDTYIGVASSNGTYTVSPKQTPMTAGTSITGTLTDDSTSGTVTTPGTKKALVTAQAVKDLFDSTISSTDDGKLLATSKAVYDYAQPQTPNTNTTNVYVGRNAGSGASTWDKLATEGYVTTDTTTAGTYKLKLDGNKITGIGNDAGTAIANVGVSGATDATKEKLTTAKAVYDFVTTYGGDTYQPKVASNESSAPTATTMYIGKYVPANGATPASETWDRFVTDGYVTTDTTTAGTYKIKLDGNKIAATSDITGATSSNASGEKLATAWSVKGLLNDATESSGTYTTTISSSSANNVYPSSRNVYEYVKSQTGGNVIPAMSADCIAAITSGTPNNHCALVASWINGAIGLEWTVIAQP